MAANVVDDLREMNPMPTVSYFFCQHEEPTSLQARTILGCIVRQILERTLNNAENIPLDESSKPFDLDRVLGLFKESSSQAPLYIILDGLYECPEKEINIVLKSIKQMQEINQSLRFYYSNRQDAFQWAASILPPKGIILMSDSNEDMGLYISESLYSRIVSEDLVIHDPKLIVQIEDTLIQKAKGM